METIDPNEIPTPEAEATPEPIVAPQTRETEIEEPLSDQLLAEARDPDAQMREANRRADEAAGIAEQLVWPPYDVEVQLFDGKTYKLPRVELKWSSSRERMLNMLQRADGEGSIPGSGGRVFANACLTLYLACNETAEWQRRRSVTNGRNTMMLPPLRSDHAEFLEAIDRWVDVWIPQSLAQEAIECAFRLIEVHDSTRHVIIDPAGELGKS